MSAIHWISEWCLDAPGGKRGIVRFRAVFLGDAPDQPPETLWEFVRPADTHGPERVALNVLEFHVIYGRTG